MSKRLADRGSGFTTLAPDLKDRPLVWGKPSRARGSPRTDVADADRPFLGGYLMDSLEHLKAC